MSKTVLTGVRLFTGGVDLTGASNKVELTSEIEAKETTNYSSQGYKEVVGGIASTAVSASGQWEAGDPSKVDDASWLHLGQIGPCTIGPVGAAVGDLAYLAKVLCKSYKLGDAVGEVAPWEAEGSGNWPLVRGQVAHPPGTARTASGTGTGLNIGAVAAGKRMYASLHVLSVAGTTPSITVSVESSADNTFAAPTTQLTFTAATAVTGEILRTDGTAITDTWWRVAWTISGTSPSFLFAAALGIG